MSDEQPQPPGAQDPDRGAPAPEALPREAPQQTGEAAGSEGDPLLRDQAPAGPQSLIGAEASVPPQPPTSPQPPTPQQPQADQQLQADQQPPAPEATPQAPAAWAWAQASRTVTRETEPLEYHRLLRGVKKYRWWKPLALLVVAAVYFGILTVALGLALAPIMFAVDPTYASEMMTGEAELLDTQRPISLVFSLLSIIVMLPAVLLAMLTLGMRPMGRVWSVAGRIRWGLLARTLGAAVLAVIAMNVVGTGVSLLFNQPSAGDAVVATPADFDAAAAVVSLVLILLLVPVQAATEEVVFRGLFMQVLGSWVRAPWFAILVPSVAFAAAHIYDVWGLLAVGFMGLVAAWLTWRTGGLEAAIAIHVVNNLVAFGIMTSGVTGETAQTEDTGGVGLVIGEVAGLALFAWLVLRIWRKGGHGRARIDIVEVSEPVTVTAAPEGDDRVV